MKVVGEETDVVPSERDVDQYWERGYWIAPKVFKDGEIEQLNHAHDRIWSGAIDGDGYYFEGKPPQVVTGSPAVRKIQNGWWINAEIRSAVLSSRIGRIAAALMRVPRARLWHDQVIEKPGSGEGSETLAGNVGWHQDYAYWRCTDTTNMVSAWIALQDTDLSNGAMMTLVGSHRWGLLPGSATFRDQDMAGLRERFASQVGEAWIEEPCILKAGEVSFHHALCFHGSGPNQTARPRRCVTVHAMPDGTSYEIAPAAGEPRSAVYHTNVRLLGPTPRQGDRYDNHFFPLLDDAAYNHQMQRE